LLIEPFVVEDRAHNSYSQAMNHNARSSGAALAVCAVREHQRQEIADFLKTAFGADLSPGMLSPEFLQWKFFAPRPGRDGDRSFTIRQAGRIAAHACVWPTGFCLPRGRTKSCHLLDWAADPAVPGAGVTLYQHLMQLTDFVMAIGGSAQARRVLPKIGFRRYSQLEYYARVVRPWRQYRTRPRSSAFREWLRLGRNLAWSLSPLPRAAGNWSAAPVSSAGAWLDKLVSHCQPSIASWGLRSAEMVNYLLACPAAACRLFSLQRDNVACGYFVLNQVGGQFRVVDLVVNSDAQADWRNACRLAFRTAAAASDCCEVVYAVSLPWLGEILRECGFQRRNIRPVLVFDPQRVLADAPPLHLQMVDSDAFFLHDPSYPFLT
jgi:hypothetical protein